MTARTGVILRLLGPLIEVACLILLMGGQGRDRRLFGVPVEYPLYGGLALGLGLVVVGLVASRPAPRGHDGGGRR